MELNLVEVNWTPGWRIIPSIFPVISLFEKVADPADLDAVFYLESLTNDRLRNEVGDLNLVPPEERVSGPGTSVIMAAFTHLNPQGSRFSDGSYGVFYAAQELNTAITESVFHRENFLRLTQQDPMEVDMRVYQIDLHGLLHDICKQTQLTAIYHPQDYSCSQQLSRELRSQGLDGIQYDSVRCEGGVNAAIFRPKLIQNCRQERHLCYVWDGNRITHKYVKKLLA